MDCLGGLESNIIEEESLVVNWDSFFGLNHSLELYDCVGIVNFDSNDLGWIYLNIDMETGSQCENRSFGEVLISTSFSVIHDDLT